MKSIYLNLGFLLILVFTISSCQKQGCTNANAENYDADATEDDGTCTFARDKFIGSYDVSRSCVYESDSSFTLQVSVGPNDDEIVLKNLFGWNESLRAQVSGADISFKDENAGITYEGTGYLAGNELIVTYDVCETFYYPCSDPDECTSTCTKQ